MARGELEAAGCHVAETSTARPWETPVVIVLESESSQQRAASRRWTAVILSSVSLLAICGFLLASSGSVKAPVSLGAYSWGCDGCLPGSRYFPPSAAKAFGHYEVYADPGKCRQLLLCAVCDARK
eukprot:3122885-Rhodomonas_salina.2